MTKNDKRFRTWNITLNYDYEIHDDKGNLISAITPAEWKAKIERLIAFNADDGWCAYIFHGKDILEDGLPKPLHVHILKNFKEAKTQTAVMKMFNVSREANCTNARSITSSARYLTHRTSQAMDDGKHQYNIDEVQTINCDYFELIKNKSDRTISQKEVDEIVMGLSIDIGNGKLYWLKARELLIDKFDEIEGIKLWNKYSRIFEKNFKEYIQNKAEDYKLKGRNLTTFFIWGDSEVGKTWLAKCMCLLLSDRIHMVPASGKNKTFDIAGLYDGEKASLWNEVSGLELSNKEFLDRFDPKTYSPSNSRGKDKHCLSDYFFLTSTDALETVVNNLMPNEQIEEFEIKRIKRHEINRRLPIEIKCISLGYKKTEFVIRLYDPKNRDRFTLDSVICKNIESENQMKKAAKEILTILGILEKEKED
ncbi:Rep family protein [Lactococcus lactis]|nr:Rep family protein [Lactococcus lactis]